MSTKIVINCCFGGFSLSDAGEARYRALGGTKEFSRDIPRHDPRLVQTVEELGELANGRSADLKVVTVESVNYRVNGYDGMERIETPDSIEWVDAKARGEWTPSMVALAAEVEAQAPAGTYIAAYHNAGFALELPNGNIVSVTWRAGQYCEHRYTRDRFGREMPEGFDSVDAEVAVIPYEGAPVDEWHWFPDTYENVGGWHSPQQVRDLIEWARENEVVPRPKLPERASLEELVTACKGEIGDEYRASEDDEEPGMQLTVGWDGRKDWSFQTGDNSFTGGAYGYQHWAVVSVRRDSEPRALANEIIDQLEEVAS